MINKKVIQNKGITLIALVITIVVLLILAGITISNIVGKNGILNKANSAVTETEKGEIKEQLSLSLTKLDILASKNNKGIKEYCENKEAFIENSTWNNNIYNISEYSLIDDTISLKINKTSGSKKTYSYKIDINSQVIEEIETDNEEPVPNPTQKPTPTQEPTPTPEPEPATSSEYFSWEVSDNVATLTGLTEAGITAYNNKEQNIINLVIPSEYNGVQDIKIGAHVFENKEFIEKVVLGDNVIAVGYGAFYNCTGIKELQIPISIDSEKNDGIAANVPFEKCANIEKISFTKGKTGKGFDYSYSDNTYNWTPWYKSRDNLKEIEFEEGVEYIEAKLKGYEDLQDKIIHMANEMNLFEKSVIYPETAYGSAISIARGIRNRVYSRYTTKGLVELLGMDETDITNIIKSIQSIDFDIYGQAFSEDKLRDKYLYVTSVRIKEVSVCIAELIYRIVIYNADIDVVKCVSDLLAFDDDYKGEILELVNELLREHIRRMNKVIKTTGYPVEAILQMMDYPALNQEEYKKRIASITEILERL